MSEKISYLASKTYAITVNPKDDLQCFDCMKAKDRWKGVVLHIIEEFEKYKSFYWELYFECSEPDHVNINTRTRIHAHGFINIDDLPQFLLVDLNQLGKKYDIKIRNLKDDGYKTYCMKQHDQMASLYPLYYSSSLSDERINRKLRKKKEKEAALLKKNFGIVYGAFD